MNINRKILKLFATILLMFATICYFTFPNLYFVSEYNKCLKSEPNNLVNATVLSCDGVLIKTQFDINNQTGICTVHLENPTCCDFPTNSLYIYVSKDTTNCDMSSRSYKCNNDLILFNAVSGIFILAGWAMFIIFVIF